MAQKVITFNLDSITAQSIKGIEQFFVQHFGVEINKTEIFKRGIDLYFKEIMAQAKEKDNG
jgi:hypothetical protein